MNFSSEDLKTLSFSYFVSMGNLSRNDNVALGERAALIILEAARELFE